MRLLVDTAAWVALNNRADENHRAAVEFVSQFKTDPVLFTTTDYIVDETVTFLSQMRLTDPFFEVNGPEGNPFDKWRSIQ